MDKILKEKTEQWMTLERKTLEQRKKAEQFYEEEMMEHIVREYISNNKSKLKEKAKYLIVSVGTSYEPIVLNISLLQPERILFLYTSQSEEILDKVMDFCCLRMSQVEKSKVNETNQTDIYREIKRCYLEWGKPEKIYIDFTGGTKAMSTAAAMAGAMIHVQMIYVGTSQYMRDFRKPLPGSETLFYINSPMDVFGDLEIDKAYALFEQYNYAGARPCAKILLLRSDTIARIRFSFGTVFFPSHIIGSSNAASKIKPSKSEICSGKYADVFLPNIAFFNSPTLSLSLVNSSSVISLSPIFIFIYSIFDTNS